MSVYSNNKYDASKSNDAWSKIFPFIELQSKILDIGCSSGALGSALKKEKQAYVTGIDIDKDDVALAKKNLDEVHLLNIEQDDVSFLGTFDIIIMADVIEHLLDPVRALKKIKKLLKKDGKLIFSIPNMANVTTRIELLRGSFEYKDFGLLDRTHLHFYDTVEVNRVFQAAGYQVLETNCTLREIPEEILRKTLEPLGIVPTKKLIELLNQPDAITYQFIGCAKPSTKPKSFKPETNSPLDSVSRYIDELNAAQQKELLAYKQNNEQLSQQIVGLNEALNAILDSKGWKTLDKFYTVKKKVTRK